jgi:predicted nucleotidyltransferase
VGLDPGLEAPLLPELLVLTEAERSCLQRYVHLLVDELGENLVDVAVFGSVARGDSWPRGMPIRSDLDLLVLVRNALEPALEQELLDATYPLFLRSGRQLGPQFRTEAAHLASPSRDAIDRDAVELRST